MRGLFDLYINERLGKKLLKFQDTFRICKTFCFVSAVNDVSNIHSKKSTVFEVSSRSLYPVAPTAAIVLSSPPFTSELETRNCGF